MRCVPRKRIQLNKHYEDDHPHFMTYAAQLAEVLRNTIFADQVSIVASFRR